MIKEFNTDTPVAVTPIPNPAQTSEQSLAGTAVLLVVLDNAQRILYANRAMLSFIGKSLPQVQKQRPDQAWDEKLLGGTPQAGGHYCDILGPKEQRIRAIRKHFPISLGQISIVQYQTSENLDNHGGPFPFNAEDLTGLGKQKWLLSTLARTLDIQSALLFDVQQDAQQPFKPRLAWFGQRFVESKDLPPEVISFFGPHPDKDRHDQQAPPEKQDLWCLTLKSLYDPHGQQLGQIAFMDTQSKADGWFGTILIEAAIPALELAVSQTQHLKNQLKSFLFDGLKELSRLAEDETNISTFLQKAIHKVRTLLGSDHVWIAQIPSFEISHQGLLVESRAEKIPPLNLSDSHSLTPIPEWIQLGDLVVERSKPMLHIPPIPAWDQNEGPSMIRKHLMVHLKACKESTWILGMLPPLQDAFKDPRDPDHPFFDIAHKVCDLIGQQLLTKQLEDSQSHFSFLTENMGEVLFRTNASLQLTHLNPAWEQLSGYAIQESLGNFLGDYFNVSEGSDYESTLGAMIQPNSQSQSWKLPLKTFSKGVIWVEIQAHPQFDERGQLRQFEGLMRELVKETRGPVGGAKDLSSLVEKSNQIAVQSYDADFKVLSWNQASQDIFGFTAKEAHGRHLCELILPESALAAWKRDLRQWMEQGIPMPPGEITLSRKNGELLRIYASHTMMKNPDGTTEFFIIGVNLTDRQQTQEALIESEQRYRNLVELSPQAMFLLANNKIIFANPAAIALIDGGENQSVLGKDFTLMVSKSMRTQLRTQLAQVQANPSAENRPYQFESFEIRRLDGQLIEVEIVAMPVSYAGDYATQIIAKDITRQKKAAEALRRSEARYALAAQGSNDGLWDWDLISQHVYYSPRWHSMLGLEKITSETSPDFWLDRIHPDDLQGFNHNLNDHLSGSVPQFENEHRLLHEDGVYRWMLCRGVAIFDRHGQAIRMAGSLRDITKRKKVEHQLFYDAFHDNLTGLANRALFMEHLDRALHRNNRDRNQLIGIIFIDFDRFKVVNDSLGHLVGDKLLIAVAKRLLKTLPDSDLIARLGGDEFAILIEGIEFPTQVRNRSQAVHSCMKLPFYIEGNELYSSVSIGISYGVPGRDKPVDILRDADTAMYRAKARGRAQSVVFDQSMHEEVQRVMTLENDMRKAMDRNEFEVYYQPIFDLRSLSIAGFEALLRWNHPVKGIIYPSQFIDLAEETGMILDLGLKVLRKACTMMANLHKSKGEHLFLHVNLSFRQMMQSDLKGEIENILKETEFNPDLLKLELTESVVAEPGDFAVALLHDLRELGLRLCLDDFGTGYASLSYLHRLPIDSLKIDKSFIDRLLTCEKNKSMVPTIISLAHNLGLSVVAEGVENETQFRRLLDLGCEFAQGFHFGKPITEEAAIQLCLDT